MAFDRHIRELAVSTGADGDGPISRTTDPIVTGTSVLGVKYKDGVMLAADTLGSYGSLARFKDVKRVHAVGTQTVVGAGGDLSDWQELQEYLDSWVRSESLRNPVQPGQTPPHQLTTSQIFARLSNLLYGRRNKMDPLWNTCIVGGFETQGGKISTEDPGAGEPFLALVNVLGVTYSASALATGFGNHIAIPLMRKALEDLEDKPPAGGAGMPTDDGFVGKGEGWKKLDEAAARNLLETCMKVLFYRDARSLNRYHIATVTRDGVKIDPPKSATTEWAFAENIRG